LKYALKKEVGRVLVNWNPVAFAIGPVEVRWYGIAMALSFLFGIWYLVRKGVDRGLDEDALFNLAILVIVAGIVGARLVYVLTNNPQWFVHDLPEVFKIWHGGLAWHGGLLGGILVGWWYGRRKKMDFNLLADLAVPGLALGYCLVRIANIANQEVLGRMTGFAFGRWPAQPIGSAIGLILLIRFFYVEAKRPPAGYQFWSFIFYHQLLRGVVEESVRDNTLALLGYVMPHWGLGFFTLTQLATPPILLIAYLLMRYSQSRQRRSRGGLWPTLKTV
jgi:phosphatidylglycerol:prolipoprotein diacylglycerol transferase